MWQLQNNLDRCTTAKITTNVALNLIIQQNIIIINLILKNKDEIKNPRTNESKG